jgi:hypothetical protein
VYFAAGSIGAALFVELPRPLDSMAPTPCPHFGQSIAPAGDVNADHFADFVIGCPAGIPGGAVSSAPARAFVMLGAPAFPRLSVAVPLRPPMGTDMGSSFGHLVAGVGNVTGTRRTIVAVGDETTANHLHLFEFGGEAPPVPSALPLPMGLLGLLPSLTSLRPLSAMVGLGDVNRDGHGDYLLAFGHVATPLVVLVPSRQAPSRLFPSILADPIVSLTGAGDFEADGFDDFAVGVRLAPGGGRVLLYPGAASYGPMLSPSVGAFILAEPAGRARYGLSLAAGR